MADIKKYKGAVFFDVDGTLIDERIGVSVPTEATRDAIARLRENGYLACVATGRAKCYLCDLQTEFDCYVTCNGAIVELDGEIYPQYMDDGKLRSLLSYLDENGFGFSFETNERCYVGAKKSKEFLNAMRASRIDTKSFTVTDNFEGLRFCKAMITFSDEAKYRALCEKFGMDFDIVQHHTDPEADINLARISKAVGVARVLELTGIDRDNTYAFGDGANDAELFGTVGCGIAMTPHSSALDGVAKMVTGGVADGGIPNALVKLGLI